MGERCLVPSAVSERVKKTLGGARRATPLQRARRRGFLRRSLAERIALARAAQRVRARKAGLNAEEMLHKQEAGGGSKEEDAPAEDPGKRKYGLQHRDKKSKADDVYQDRMHEYIEQEVAKLRVSPRTGSRGPLAALGRSAEAVNERMPACALARARSPGPIQRWRRKERWRSSCRSQST